MTTKKKKKTPAKNKPNGSTSTSTTSVRQSVVTPAVPVSDAEKELFNFVGDDPESSPRQAQPVDLNDLNLNAADRDVSAADKINSAKTKSKPAAAPKGKKAESDKDGPAVPPEVRELLTRPDALKKVFLAINERLTEQGSIWAAPKTEAAELADCTVAIIDKYFPDLEKWGTEVAFVFAVAMYATPRFMMLIQQRKEAAESVSAAAKAAPAAGNPSPSRSSVKLRKTPIV